MCKRQKHEKLLFVTVQTILQQEILNLTTADYLIAAVVSAGYRSKSPDENTLNEVSNIMQEHNINVVQLEAFPTVDCN